jgi:hypothetical protein
VAAISNPSFAGTVTIGGSTGANAGLKFTIGVPVTEPFVGHVEFLGDALQVTVQEGGVPTRKTVSFTEDLGTMAVQNAANVQITGGSITALSAFDHTVVDGGNF